MRIHLYSIHGLFRGSDLEIGLDADNGGQIVYVMELARALSQRPEVSSVHLFTRRIDDYRVSGDYNVPVEKVDEKFDIRRVWCGGKKYVPKEKLWDHLDEFVSQSINHIKSEKIFPDWIHSHYADAGYVATELSAYLNVPFAHTGHSLGRPKLQKLEAAGLDGDEALARYRFEDRFAAEEGILANAQFILSSTAQEISTYQAYENYLQAEYHVIPPGIDFERYHPYFDEEYEGEETSHLVKKEARFSVRENIERFLAEPTRPFILAICRPDKKKNIDGLVHAYGTDPELQAIANLVVFAGIRGDISELPPGEKEVLTDLLLLMDKYNLYGKLAIPKKHDIESEVPEIYRLCARKKGVFINIALTEPFGLTILEATGCGLPVVATKEGGPAEIIPKCKNGLLVSPTDSKEIQEALKKILTSEDKWRTYSKHGMRLVRENYSWDSHVEQYLDLVKKSRDNFESFRSKSLAKSPQLYERLKVADKMIISDIDGTLVSETEDYSGLDQLKTFLKERGKEFVFGVATGRSLEKVEEVVEEFDLPVPDVVISSVGSYIYYGPNKRFLDKGWLKHIDFRWNADVIRERVSQIKGLTLQEPENLNPFKISFYLDEPDFDTTEIYRSLGPQAHVINIFVTQSTYLDILPKRASKGKAVRYIGQKWTIPLNQSVVCGDSGNDIDMFSGAISGVVVGNHSPEMKELRKVRRVYFSPEPSTMGILDGLRHFKFSDKLT